MAATMKWVKSSYCSDSACVEVALDGDTVAVRDGKNREGAVLRVSKPEWQGFVAKILAGDYPR
ncbi:DUF397 domain-containing protein [Symbioplanes lichenis]|uniref:DUF397 domain-containing protein n=1 Tax=Symbioplanes lichenis TaxID=1629072 RepID=UPI002738AEFF|nr:DUF397 domain-containing protein [Actinoplanes lichenis]